VPLEATKEKRITLPLDWNTEAGSLSSDRIRHMCNKTVSEMDMATLPRPHSSLPVPKGDLQESWRGTFHKGM